MESFATANNKQDQVSTMQKTDWTNYSFFLAWSGLEKGFTNVFINISAQRTKILLFGRNFIFEMRKKSGHLHG